MGGGEKKLMLLSMVSTYGHGLCYILPSLISPWLALRRLPMWLVLRRRSRLSRAVFYTLVCELRSLEAANYSTDMLSIGKVLLSTFLPYYFGFNEMNFVFMRLLWPAVASLFCGISLRGTKGFSFEGNVEAELRKLKFYAYAV